MSPSPLPSSMSSRLLRTALRTRRVPRIPIHSIAPRHFTTSSAKMGVHNIESLTDFKRTIASEDKLIVVDAFATWCGPCKQIAPLVVKWSNSDEFKDKVSFVKFDVDDVPDLAQELGIRAMPTFIFFKNGDKLAEFAGANPGALQGLLRKYTVVEGEETKEAAESSKETSPEADKVDKE
ncbi:thioredoxin-like protein [Podospora didyma]|uniref:Thioredoxin-like protein n=1 Tax=Podospora didyma TaxID=330526 RepID=A0AAE0U4H9_9PEZI|nr:thioredoxin-like protein [Podospora didyma]